MTTTEQEIAIAQACGWTSDTILVEHNEGYNWTDKVTRWWSPKDRLGMSEESLLPRYTSDLNACHEMEKVQTDEQWQIYTDWLEALNPCENRQWRSCASATAAHKSEAFLRTLGKWKD